MLDRSILARILHVALASGSSPKTHTVPRTVPPIHAQQPRPRVVSHLAYRFVHSFELLWPIHPIFCFFILPNSSNSCRQLFSPLSDRSTSGREDRGPFEALYPQGRHFTATNNQNKGHSPYISRRHMKARCFSMLLPYQQNTTTDPGVIYISGPSRLFIRRVSSVACVSPT